MSKHRIRRWLQVGILDLMTLTAIAAVVTFLWRPVQARAHRAPPYVVGGWHGEDGTWEGTDVTYLLLYPDGCYRYLPRGGALRTGFRWSVRPLGGTPDTFLLVFGNEQFAIRSEWGSEVIEVLNADGSVKLLLRQNYRFEGLWQDGAPHGRWKITYLSRPGPHPPGTQQSPWAERP